MDYVKYTPDGSRHYLRPELNQWKNAVLSTAQESALYAITVKLQLTYKLWINNWVTGSLWSPGSRFEIQSATEVYRRIIQGSTDRGVNHYRCKWCNKPIRSLETLIGVEAGERTWWQPWTDRSMPSAGKHVLGAKGGLVWGKHATDENM